MLSLSGVFLTMNGLFSVEKAWFVLSVGLIAFAYGFATHAWDLFPKSYVVTAANQVGRQTSGMLWTSDAEEYTTPRAYERSGARTMDSTAVQPGLTMVVSSWADDDGTMVPGARLIDRHGRTVHGWRPDREAIFGGTALKGGDPATAKFHGAHLRPNGDLLLALSYIGLVRLDACGDVEWTLAEGAHHSVTAAEDGTFWVSGVSDERRSTTDMHPDGFPGLDASVWIDRLLHVSADGDLLNDINVLDVLYANGLERYVRMARARGAYEAGNGDPTHLNDVEPLPASMADEYPTFEAGDLVVSLKHPNLVLVLDPDTGTVKWHTDSGPDDRYHLLQQHDPDFLGDGWIGVFNNREDFTDRGTMLGGSQILAFQPHTDSVAVLFPTPQSDSIYTKNRGKWQPLANGNYLLTESNAGRALEVTPEGRTVWEWIHEPHSASQVPFVTSADRYALPQEEVASWSCSSLDTTSASTGPNRAGRAAD